jgi:copper(I)-binding protein
MKRMTYLLVALPLLVGSNDAATHGYKRKTLEVIHPYTFEKPEPGGRDAIVGMTLRNKGRQTERLIGATSVIAERVEIVVPNAEGTRVDPGSTKTRIEIRAGAEVELRASAAHVRLVGLKKELAAYDTLPMTLSFERAGRLEIDVMVEEVIEKK